MYSASIASPSVGRSGVATMCRTPLQRPRGRTRTASVDLAQSAAIHGYAALSSEFHGSYALSSKLDLSSEEIGVNQLVLGIIETPD